jgi:hypothetical protein
MIDEVDLVVLKHDLPTDRLAAGDVGIVELVRQQGAGYEVTLAFKFLTRETALSSDTATRSGLQNSRACSKFCVEPRTG